jgi:hypothetical protein
MGLKLANNASSLLSSSITDSQTTLAITTGDESKFPTLGAGDWHPVTVVDSNANREIMRCTARSGLTLTVVRGQEGTTALAFDAGARVEVRVTNAVIDGLTTEDERLAGVTGAALEKDVAGGVDVTLTADEAANLLHKLSGTVTADIAYILPESPAFIIVENGTAGTFSVTVETSDVSSVGVVVPQGYIQALVSDGVDVKALGPALAADLAASLFSNSLRLKEQADSPAYVAASGVLFTKAVSSKSELFYRDGVDVEVPLTKAGAVQAFPAGTKLLFPQASAPLGWTKDTDVDDRVIRVVSGTGGATAGSWTISGLTNGNTGSTALTLAQIPSHNHTITVGGGTLGTGSHVARGTTTDGTKTTSSSGSGNSHAHTGPAISSSGAWRPSNLSCIKCTKD